MIKVVEERVPEQKIVNQPLIKRDETIKKQIKELKDITNISKI